MNNLPRSYTLDLPAQGNLAFNLPLGDCAQRTASVGERVCLDVGIGQQRCPSQVNQAGP